MSNEDPTVSVIIPCYNAAAFVERAVRSVMEQRKQPLQVVCVDDGSTDNTLEVLNGLSDLYSNRIDVLTGDWAGAGAARNKGLAIAQGDYVQFLDADDALLPDKLWTQTQLIARQDQEPALVAGGYERIWTDGFRDFRGTKYPDLWASLIDSQLGVTSANLWLRRAVIEAGRWRESQSSSQEYELMFRMLKRGAAVALSHDPLTHKYVEPGGITAMSGRPNPRRHQNLLIFIELRRSIADYLEAQGLLTGVVRRVYYEVLHQQCKQLLFYDAARAVRIHREVIPADYRLQTDDGTGSLAIDELLAAPTAVADALAPDAAGGG